MNKKSYVLILLASLFLIFVNSSSAKAVSIGNQTPGWLSLSVSAWGQNAQYEYFDFLPGATESWDREDSRGVLMAEGTDDWIVRMYYIDSKFVGAFNYTSDLKSHKTGRIINPINVNVPQGNTSEIKVINQSSTTKNVSISKWSKSDDGGVFKINPNSSEVWNRNLTGNRGYIMDINDSRYYIKPGKTIYINSSGFPTIDNVRIPSISLAN